MGVRFLLVWSVLAMLFLVASGAACLAAGNVAEGTILADQWCSECHAIKPGQMSPNAKAPTFQRIAAEPSATPYALRIFLRTPHATMPNLKIEAADITDLAAYIHSLRR
jgi:mono/diheme cytochrome c family protein